MLLHQAFLGGMTKLETSSIWEFTTFRTT